MVILAPNMRHVDVENHVPRSKGRALINQSELYSFRVFARRISGEVAVLYHRQQGPQRLWYPKNTFTVKVMEETVSVSQHFPPVNGTTHISLFPTIFTISHNHPNKTPSPPPSLLCSPSLLLFSNNKVREGYEDKLKLAIMSRYANGSSFIFFFFPLFFISMVSSELPLKQRNAMNGFFNSVNEKDPNPCSWKRVKCNSNNSSITHLSLSGLDLPSSDLINGLCQIDSLQHLDLSNNSLLSIPDVFIRDCGGINGLKLLNFSRNWLSGFLPTFRGFGGLQFLDVSGNSLRGNIDLQLDALVEIRSLNLSFNQFNGSVPTHFGKSMVLEELRLSNNNFSGGIPEELMNYRNLTVLDLSVNDLSGSVPDTMGNLSKLETLLLSSNRLSGEIPESLSSIKTLSRLGANQNQFTGSVPRGISKYVRNLDLSYNELNGSIPSDFLSPLSLQTVDLSSNKLEGPIPVNISQNLIRLRLGNNLLNGIIPSVADRLPSNLIYLELGNNNLTGEIPWELGRCKSLALLDLAQNELTGLLPKELGNLTELQVLKLQSNNLTGGIPDQFSQLRKLSILNISRNLLTGSIPSAISKLDKLMNLNFQNNGLNGSIPYSIGSMNSLLELQLGNNKLSGKIPTMPPNLQISLNLSRNLFSGPIPDAIKGLGSLEVLDLSNNDFTGEIPGFLAAMGSLTILLLSNNHQLTGTLPAFPQRDIIIDTNGTNVHITTPSPPSPPAALHKKKDSTVVAVVVAVSTAILVVAIIGMVFVLVSRRFYRVNDETPQGEGPSFPRVIDYRMITANSIHRSSIDFTRAMEEIRNPANLMLKNRFSTFYKAIMPCGASYYIKKLNWSHKIFQLGNHERFGEELEVLGKLSNSNIMTPLAYVLTEESAYLFYEYAQKGTLFNVLHGSLGHALDWASRYSIAIGVAQGLAFLHGCTTGPILLLDLSTKSILLKSLKEPQIGDIELYKVIDPSKSTGSLSTVAGSVGYIPPGKAF